MSTPSPTVSPAPGTSPPATNGSSPPPAFPPPLPAGNGTLPLPSPTVPAPRPPVAATPPPSNSPSPPPDAASPPSSESPPSPPPPDARPSPPGSTSPPTTPSPPSPPPPDARPSPPSPPGSTSPPTTPSPPSPPPPDARPSPPSPPGSTSPPTTPSPPSPPPPDARPSPPGSTSPPTTPSPPSPPPPDARPSPPGSTSPPTISSPPSPPSNSNSTGIVMGAVIAGLFALVVVGVIFFGCCRKKKKKSDLPDYGYPPPPHKGDPYGGGQKRWPYRAPPPADNVGKFPPQLPLPPAYGSRPPHSPPGGPSLQSSLPPPAITSSGGPSSNYSGSKAPLPPLTPGLALGFSKNTFSLEELAMATDGFSDANFLGQGAFGYVHKGILPNGKEVAIKQLKAGSWQGEREFQAEVEIISRVHHRHLVSLVGYCIVDGQKMLVYEFLPNKTLEHHLHGKGRPTLEWSVRQKIALGAAKGLAYLHEDCHPKIIHRDIKAANILLDYNFDAKVADFGLAKDAPDANTHLSTRVMGTFGYLAPEYASSGKVSYKSDVYSFGVMLLELITGRQPVNSSPSHEDDTLVNWAMPLLARAMEEGKYDHLVDPKLQNDYDREEMSQMVACAAGSVRHLARHRPRMSQIVRTLEGGGVSLDSLNDGGIAPGHSRIDGSSGYDSSSQQYNTFQRNEDIKRHYQLAFESQDHGSSEYGGVTSEYGLNPSTSSSEGQLTREVGVGSAKQG